MLREELLRPGFQPERLAVGTVTDAYQPIERDLRSTRQVLAVLALRLGDAAQFI